MVVDADVLVTSTAGVDDVTVTDSCTDDSCIRKSTVGTEPRSRRTLPRLAGLNPERFAVSVYIPVGRLIS